MWPSYVHGSYLSCCFPNNQSINQYLNPYIREMQRAYYLSESYLSCCGNHDLCEGVPSTSSTSHRASSENSSLSSIWGTSFLFFTWLGSKTLASLVFARTVIHIARTFLKIGNGGPRSLERRCRSITRGETTLMSKLQWWIAIEVWSHYPLITHQTRVTIDHCKFLGSH